MRRRLSDLDPYLSPPWRDQFSPAEEARQDAEQRYWETEGEWLLELEPDVDPFRATETTLDREENGRV